jgi:hypothetical protein
MVIFGLGTRWAPNVRSQSPKALTPNTKMGKIQRLGGTHKRGQMKVVKVLDAPRFSNKCMSSPWGDPQGVYL